MQLTLTPHCARPTVPSAQGWARCSPAVARGGASQPRNESGCCRLTAAQPTPGESLGQLAPNRACESEGEPPAAGEVRARRRACYMPQACVLHRDPQLREPAITTALLLAKRGSKAWGRRTG